MTPDISATNNKYSMNKDDHIEYWSFLDAPAKKLARLEEEP
jgi:hypothetical protein